MFILASLTGSAGAFLLCNKEHTISATTRPVTACESTYSRSEWQEEFGPTTEQLTSEQLRRASLERWLQLPETWASAKEKNAVQQSAFSSKETYQKRLQALDADHPFRQGRTRKQRSAELIHAAELGNATRLELLLRAGADVDAVDLYRITSLHYAACHGHMEAVQMLLRWGAKIHPTLEESVGGISSSSPLRAAFAKGHTKIFAVLNSHSSRGSNDLDRPPTTHFNESAIQRQFERDTRTVGSSSSPSSRILTTTTVIPLDSDHVGAGSFYMDNAFSVDFIEKLVTLHESLRKVGQQHGRDHPRAMQSTNAARRSHYCDTEGWLSAALANALQQQSQAQLQSSSSSPQHVFSHVRFISYLGEDAVTSFLAPHKDFPVLDRSRGRTSTHTFILYLTTVAQGGETVLLDHLPANNINLYEDGPLEQNNSRLDGRIVRYAVKPVQGRLFVFPHGCPHAGQNVVEGSKLILRGDMC